MDKLLTLVTIFTVSTTVVVALKEQDEYWRTVCPKCGVEGAYSTRTIDKRKTRGVEEHELFLCKDCKPYKLRKGRMTGHEVWEAYKKEMGIK
jgi:hypothetical protein